jgi:hypothetical protein
LRRRSRLRQGTKEAGSGEPLEESIDEGCRSPRSIASHQPAAYFVCHSSIEPMEELYRQLYFVFGRPEWRNKVAQTKRASWQHLTHQIS